MIRPAINPIVDPRFRKDVGDQIERLLEVLDAMDGDCDIEDSDEDDQCDDDGVVEH